MPKVYVAVVGGLALLLGLGAAANAEEPGVFRCRLNGCRIGPPPQALPPARHFDTWMHGGPHFNVAAPSESGTPTARPAINWNSTLTSP